MHPSVRIDPEPFLTLHHISKRFGPLWANRSISMDLREGEIHAIVGENGAGKSTLMKIMNGHLQPDSGEIRLNGHRVAFRHPQDAMHAGIGMAHQRFLIFPQLTALENVIVGFEPGVLGWINRKQAKHEVMEICQSVGFDLSLNAMASELSFAHRQQIEILRLLYRKVKVLILDEPTSLLALPETERFLGLLQSLQTAGRTILFVTHRLREVFAIADRVSVLSRGELLGSYPISEITAEQLVELIMLGGKPVPISERLSEDSQCDDTVTVSQLCGSGFQPRMDGQFRGETPLPQMGWTPTSNSQTGSKDRPTFESRVSLLELREVTTRPDAHEAGLDGFSLDIHEGEVFGLGGVVGNGQRTLAHLLSGMVQPECGSVLLSGEEITHLPPGKRAEMGLCWLPANPLEEALLPPRAIWENVLLGRQRHQSFQHHGWLNRRAIETWATEQLQHSEVVHSDLRDSVNSLSGGNLQKLALTRVLDGAPRVVVLEQPACGLDIRAQERLRDRVRQLNAGGVAFILISYDLDELLALSHRVGVLYRGRLMGIVKRDEVSLELLGKWMLGLQS
jgi:general nucleoside transport system ATP-binding protein